MSAWQISSAPPIKVNKELFLERNRKGDFEYDLSPSDLVNSNMPVAELSSAYDATTIHARPRFEFNYEVYQKAQKLKKQTLMEVSEIPNNTEISNNTEIPNLDRAVAFLPERIQDRIMKLSQQLKGLGVDETQIAKDVQQVAETYNRMNPQQLQLQEQKLDKVQNTLTRILDSMLFAKNNGDEGTANEKIVEYQQVLWENRGILSALPLLAIAVPKMINAPAYLQQVANFIL